MAHRNIKKKHYTKFPGILVQCQSGRYLAYYEHRSDIIANADSEKEAKKVLKEMYADVLKYEKEQEEKRLPANSIPPFKTKSFTQKFLVA